MYVPHSALLSPHVSLSVSLSLCLSSRGWRQTTKQRTHQMKRKFDCKVECRNFAVSCRIFHHLFDRSSACTCDGLLIFRLCPLWCCFVERLKLGFSAFCLHCVLFEHVPVLLLIETDMSGGEPRRHHCDLIADELDRSMARARPWLSRRLGHCVTPQLSDRIHGALQITQTIRFHVNLFTSSLKPSQSKQPVEAT